MKKIAIIATTDSNLNIQIIDYLICLGGVNEYNLLGNILSKGYYAINHNNIIGAYLGTPNTEEYDIVEVPLDKSSKTPIDSSRKSDTDISAFNKAIEYVQKTYCTNHVNIPYLLIGDVAELIKILTGNDVELNILTDFSKEKNSHYHYKAKECFFNDLITHSKKYDGLSLGICVDEGYTINNEPILWFNKPFLGFTWQYKRYVRLTKYSTNE
jgi:hypothetical protein